MRRLVGDIGGTHTRLLFTDDAAANPVSITSVYHSLDYPSLEVIIEQFLAENTIQPPFDAVCMAVAGPVLAGTAVITNLPWIIREETLRSLLRTQPLCLINDLAAVAYAVPTLNEKEVVVIHPGDDSLEAPPETGAAVVAVGTGIGVSHLVKQGDAYIALSSETGHTGFAPTTAEQVALLSWLRRWQTPVSIETLLSGGGLAILYQFFREQGFHTESPEVRAAIRHTHPAQVVTRYALADADALCVTAVNSFIEILGSVLGDIVLHYFPVNALYLAGGVITPIRPLLSNHQRFVEAYINKGPMRPYLQRLPIKLILTEQPGLEGADNHARQLFG